MSTTKIRATAAGAGAATQMRAEAECGLPGRGWIALPAGLLATRQPDE